MNGPHDPDTLAWNLIEWADMARKMPASFEKCGITYHLTGADGVPIGKILPGRGVMTLWDHHRLGITRDIPHVYDPSRYRRIEDEIRRHLARAGLFAIQGAAISTYDQIISNRAGGNANDIAIVKTSITTVANTWSTLWHAGGQPAAGTYLATTPPTDALLDRTNAAAISTYLSNPSGTNKKYLLTFGYTSTQQTNMAVLVDIINHSGAYRLSVNTAETVTTPTTASERQYGSGTGNGNLLTFIVATAGTPGAGTFTAQYVNQAASAVNAPALTVAATAVVADEIFSSTSAVTAGSGTFFVPLVSGDTGVQAVKQTTASVAGTGTLASNVFFPLHFLPGLAGNAFVERDSTTQIDGLTELVNVSQVIGHLALYVLPNGATSGALTAQLRTVQG